MSAHQSTRWFWSDWLGDPAVRRLTPAERGVWIDLLGIAATALPAGYIVDEKGNALTMDEIGRIANCSPAVASNLVNGILEKGAASRDRTGRLFNRRMVRDVALSEKKRRAGKLGAAVTALRWHEIQGSPQHLPGHVPRQNGARAVPEEKINTTDDAAREGSAMGKRDRGLASEALAEVMHRKGWVPK
jgi:hypothetical protein